MKSATFPCETDRLNQKLDLLKLEERKKGMSLYLSSFKNTLSHKK